MESPLGPPCDTGPSSMTVASCCRRCSWKSAWSKRRTIKICWGMEPSVKLGPVGCDQLYFPKLWNWTHFARETAGSSRIGNDTYWYIAFSHVTPHENSNGNALFRTGPGYLWYAVNHLQSWWMSKICSASAAAVFSTSGDKPFWDSPDFFPARKRRDPRIWSQYIGSNAVSKNPGESTLSS